METHNRGKGGIETEFEILLARHRLTVPPNWWKGSVNCFEEMVRKSEELSRLDSSFAPYQNEFSWDEP